MVNIHVPRFAPRGVPSRVLTVVVKVLRVASAVSSATASTSPQAARVWGERTGAGVTARPDSNTSSTATGGEQEDQRGGRTWGEVK